MLSFARFLLEGKTIRGVNTNPQPKKLPQKAYRLKRPFKKLNPVVKKTEKPKAFFITRHTKRVIQKATEPGKVFKPSQVTQTGKRFTRAKVKFSNKGAQHSMQQRRVGKSATHF